MDNHPEKRPSLRRIAASLDLSPSTIVHVSKGRRGRVSAETYDRVLEALGKAGYSTAAGAKTRCLGLLIPDLARPLRDRQPGVQVLSGFSQTATDAGFSVTLLECPWNIPKRILAHPSLKYVDGLAIYSGQPEPDAEEKLTQETRPWLHIGSLSEGKSAVQVTIDNRDIGQKAAGHLIAQRHQRLAVLSLAAAPALDERMQGFLLERPEAGLALAETLTLASTDNAQDAATLFVRMILKMPKKSRPTAVFCTTDRLAVELIRELHRTSISCPQDLAVVGVDNSLEGEILRPPLTTFSLPNEQAGAYAAANLVHRLMEGEWLTEKMSFPSMLLPRQSSDVTRA